MSETRFCGGHLARVPPESHPAFCTDTGAGADPLCLICDEAQAQHPPHPPTISASLYRECTGPNGVDVSTETYRLLKSKRGTSGQKL